MEAIEEIWKRPSPAFRECLTVGGDSSIPWHQLFKFNVESLSFTMTVAMQLPATMNMMQLK